MNILDLARQHQHKINHAQQVARGGRSRRKYKAYTTPQPSMSMGCHSSQIKEYAAFDKAMGVPTAYTKDGSPLITSMRHQAAYAKIHGHHNKDGVFS